MMTKDRRPQTEKRLPLFNNGFLLTFVILSLSKEKEEERIEVREVRRDLKSHSSFTKVSLLRIGSTP
jgi:hypothetical protein